MGKKSEECALGICEVQENPHPSKFSGVLVLPLSSGEASPTIWSCYANISVFIDRENNQFLKK
jgi:hypothetical protein